MMKTTKLFGFICVLILALLTVLGGLISTSDLVSAQSLDQAAGAPDGIDPQADVGTGFTYQGRLLDNGSPANGSYDFQFKLFDAPTGGAQLMTDVVKEDVVVTDGRFSAVLDFGSDIFDGDAFYLEIGVRPGASNDAFTTLAPRQALTPVPYALYATGAWSLTGNAGTDSTGNFLGTTDAQPLVFKTNDAEAMRIDPDGRISIGDSIVTAQLDADDDNNVGLRGRSDTNIGVNGISNSDVGVFGEALADTGDTEGVIGRVNSAAGEAIQAENISDNPLANIIAACSLSSCQEVEFLVKRNGDVLADGSFTGPADFAEMMAVAGGPDVVEPGDVLVIGPDGRLTPAVMPYATNLAGVYSARPGFVGDTQIAERGLQMYEPVDAAEVNKIRQDQVPVALIGIVPVKATADNGAIQPGDLLTTSAVPGHAMKAEPVESNGAEIYPTGAILGKALEPLAEGRGIIQVLVTLR